MRHSQCTKSLSEFRSGSVYIKHFTSGGKFNKKCFRNINAPLGEKFKITTYMYKAWMQLIISEKCNKYFLERKIK